MRERGRWGEVEGVRGGGRDMRKRIKRTSYLPSFVYLHVHTAHAHSLPLLFDSLPFTASLFSHLFPSLSNNLRRSCAFIAL